MEARAEHSAQYCYKLKPQVALLLPHTDYKENEGGSEGFSFKQAFNYGHPNGYGETGRWRYDTYGEILV